MSAKDTDRTQPDAGPRNRRRTARYECHGLAEASRVPSTGLRRGIIRNLSLGGCYIEIEQPFVAPTYVEVVLNVGTQSFRVTGTVKVAYEAAMGIQFDRLSAGGIKSLQELITEFEELSKAAK